MKILRMLFAILILASTLVGCSGYVVLQKEELRMAFALCEDQDGLTKVAVRQWSRRIIESQYEYESELGIYCANGAVFFVTRDKKAPPVITKPEEAEIEKES